MPVSVGIYSVPLVCEAVPQIGCGCLAKPVLTQLGDHPDIARAWLHHRGDVIAIEWLRELDTDQQVGLLRAALGGDSHVALVATAAASALLASFPNPSALVPARDGRSAQSGRGAHHRRPSSPTAVARTRSVAR